MQAVSRCPVCRAPFRSTQECSRCGADPARLMTLLVKAQIGRKNAREALRSGNFEKARQMAEDAQSLHATKAGRGLLLLASWLELR